MLIATKALFLLFVLWLCLWHDTPFIEVNGNVYMNSIGHHIGPLVHKHYKTRFAKLVEQRKKDMTTHSKYLLVDLVATLMK